MGKRYGMSKLHRGLLTLVAGLCLLIGRSPAQAPATQTPPAPQTPPPAGRPSGTGTQGLEQSKPDSDAKAETHITPEEAKQLFGLVDQLIKFSSQETGLPIKSEVKRQLTTRTAVEKYLKEKFEDDEDSKRMQRSEIVLKKFGLLDRDFDLKPFLLALLKEQIAAYYDPKEKSVNLLDWVSVDEQKSVLAHELIYVL